MRLQPLALAAAAVLALVAGTATAQVGTAITYQAQIKDNGQPVNGLVDVRMTLFNAPIAGAQVGSPITQSVNAANGLFTVAPDFGAAPFTNNQPLFMQVEVRSPAGVGAFNLLNNRVRLAPTPFSLATRGINAAANGNVGIGTVNPIHMLHVFGQGDVATNQPHLVLETTPGSSFGPQVRLKHGGTNGSEWLLLSGGSSNGQVGAGNFGITRQGGNNVFAATPAGNIGLGTNTPAQRLHVVGNSILGSVADSAIGFDSTANARLGVINKGTGLPVFASAVNQPIIFGQTNQTDVFANIPTASVTERMRISAAGNVGIGVVNPTSRLHVAGATETTSLTVNGIANIGNGVNGLGTLSWQGNAGVNGTFPDIALRTQARPTDNFAFAATSADGLKGLTVRANGEFMSTADSHIFGQGVFPNTLISIVPPPAIPTAIVVSAGNVLKPGGGPWGNLSDARLKKNIAPLAHSLDTLLALHGVTFEYIDPTRPGAIEGTCTGFIAQDVEKVLPSWIGDSGDGYKVLNIKGFEAMTVEAIRDLRAEKDAQLNQLRAEKDAQIADLTSRLERLEALLNTQAANQSVDRD
jgi:hypothetical protein